MKTPTLRTDYEKKGGPTPTIGPIRDSFWAGYQGENGVRKGVAGSVQRKAYEAGRKRAVAEPGLSEH